MSTPSTTQTQAKNRLQTGAEEFMNDIHKGYMRNMERQMNLCAAECCSNETASIDEVMDCKEECEEKTIKAQTYVESELQRFQEGIKGCFLSCQKDSMATGANLDKYRKEVPGLLTTESSRESARQVERAVFQPKPF